MRLTFDRGTLVFEDAPATALLEGLPGCVWDARVGRYRAYAYMHAEVLDALAERGVPTDDLVAAQGAPPHPFQPIALRPYQAAAVAAWQAAGRRGLVVLPTGAGKTRVALSALAEARVATLCLVPTRVLLGQWLTEMAGVYHGPIGILGDGEHRLETVTIATFESAYRHMGRIGNRFGLLVVDEAHHFGAGVQDEALEMCTAPWRFGMTATPPPSPGARESLRRLLGPVVFELELSDLTGRWLAPFELLTITVRLDVGERRDYDACRRTYEPFVKAFFRDAPGATWEDLCRAARRSEAGRAALTAWRALRRLTEFPRAKAAALHQLLERCREAKVLVFTASNRVAYAIARSELIMPITCDIGRAERCAALEAFGRAELRALVSSQVLNEGIDVPDANVGLLVGGTRSDREHVQRAGRLLRPAPGKRALMYQLVTGGTPEVRLARDRQRCLRPSATLRRAEVCLDDRRHLSDS